MVQAERGTRQETAEVENGFIENGSTENDCCDFRSQDPGKREGCRVRDIPQPVAAGEAPPKLKTESQCM